MSQKMDQMEAENEAYQELEDTSQQDDYERQFAELEGSSGGDTDRMLEELKQKMALEDQSSTSDESEQSKRNEKGDESSSGQNAQQESSNSEDVEESLEELKKKMRDEETAT
jgi:hypothetical protein